MRNDKKSINVIFDMDGTMVDSAKITIPAFRKVCPEFRFEIPSDETIKAAIGYANPTFYYKIFPRLDKSKLREFGQRVEETERALVPDINTGMLFEGIDKILESLKKRGCKMYVASTGGVEHVDTCLKACNIFSYFDGIYCDMPDKELTVKGIVENAPDATWIMIGDRRKDSKAAKYNNIVGVGAGYGYCDKADYDEFDYVITNPMDLLEIMDSLV